MCIKSNIADYVLIGGIQSKVYVLVLLLLDNGQPFHACMFFKYKPQKIDPVIPLSLSRVSRVVLSHAVNFMVKGAHKQQQ